MHSWDYGAASDSYLYGYATNMQGQRRLPAQCRSKHSAKVDSKELTIRRIVEGRRSASLVSVVEVAKSFLGVNWTSDGNGAFTEYVRIPRAD